MTDYQQKSYMEHTFWLQILGDHGRFIFHSLSPSEVEYANQAHFFVQQFDHLLSEARKMEQASSEKWAELARHAYTLAEQIRLLKLHLMNGLLACQVKMNLSPLFINHMVNEVEEYMRILAYLLRGEVPPKLHPAHYHHLWILDAVGHAATLQIELDYTEKQLARKAEEFTKIFESFFIKAEEMAGFIRARQDLFPGLEQFNKEASLEITLFYHFLKELEELRLDCRVLGNLMPLMADHMAREECYYLFQLFEIDPNNVQKLECDPSKPRVEN